MIEPPVSFCSDVSPTERQNTPKISIVIRCRNQARTLEKVLHVLSLQEYSGDWELIVVDNESTDTTPEVAGRYGAKIVGLERDEYTHGRALNRGIEVATGEIILILSAHSLPVGRHFLQYAAVPFADTQMAAAMCIKSDLMEFTGRWYESEDIYWPADEHPATRAEMLAGVRKLMNSGLVIRRAVWEKYRFDESLESSEDKHWAITVLCEGYKIRRCCEAVYVYMLSRSGDALIERRIRSATAAYRITGQPLLNYRQYWGQNLRAFVVAVRQAYQYLRAELLVNRGLLNIPRNAQRPPQIGSREENESHR